MWLLFWKIVFVLSLSVFAVMATLVTINGIRDVKKLISALKDQEEGKPSD